MKTRYDFSKAEQGKFYRPEKELERPVYLQEGVREFYSNSGLFADMGLEEIVNKILIKEMEMLKAVVPGATTRVSGALRVTAVAARTRDTASGRNIYKKTKGVLKGVRRSR